MAEEVMGAFPVLNNLSVCEVSMQDHRHERPSSNRIPGSKLDARFILKKVGHLSLSLPQQIIEI